MWGRDLIRPLASFSSKRAGAGTALIAPTRLNINVGLYEVPSQRPAAGEDARRADEVPFSFPPPAATPLAL
jgi:hypothetical protein